VLDLAICCGGSLGWLPDPDRLQCQDDIGQPAVRDVIRAAEASLESVGIAGYDGHQWMMSAEYPAIRGFRPRGASRFATLEEIAAGPLCAMALVHPHLHPEQMTARLMAAGLDPATAHFTYAADRLLDITPAGVDKGSGLRKALNHLGIAASGVVAFGDMPNDLPMFDLAGCSVAVANAHPSVLASASMVTDAVDDDGVPHALERDGLSRRPRQIQARSADTERW
jgi:hydroxymethylpyrimidine pyrophosphatase-like HAD family hydrolase